MSYYEVVFSFFLPSSTSVSPPSAFFYLTSLFTLYDGGVMLKSVGLVKVSR